MGVNRVLSEKGIKELSHEIKHGICDFTGASTEFFLPNGDYVDKSYTKRLKEIGWLDSNLMYTTQFFKENTKAHPYIDNQGNLHALSILDLAIAIIENNTQAIDFLKQTIPKELQLDLDQALEALK